MYGAVSPLVFELAGELSFPVAEETAAAYLNIAFMIINTAAVEAGTLLTPLQTLLGTTGLLLVCTALLAPIRNTMSRSTLDSAALGEPATRTPKYSD